MSPKSDVLENQKQSDLYVSAGVNTVDVYFNKPQKLKVKVSQISSEYKGYILGLNQTLIRSQRKAEFTDQTTWEAKVKFLPYLDGDEELKPFYNQASQTKIIEGKNEYTIELEDSPQTYVPVKVDTEKCPGKEGKWKKITIEEEFLVSLIIMDQDTLKEKITQWEWKYSVEIEKDMNGKAKVIQAETKEAEEKTGQEEKLELPVVSSNTDILWICASNS